MWQSPRERGFMRREAQMQSLVKMVVMVDAVQQFFTHNYPGCLFFLCFINNPRHTNRWQVCECEDRFCRSNY